MKKEHSAADWSTRPLPGPWLEYAALDVEVLVELRDVLAAELVASRQGRVGAPGVRRPAQLHAGRSAVEPWRRTSGLHRVRGRRLLGAVRELWEARDELARERDVSPGRIIGDSAIIAAAMAMPTTRSDAARHTRLPRARRPAVRRPVARGARAGRHDARGRPAGPRAADGRSARRRGPGPSATPWPPSGSPGPRRHRHAVGRARRPGGEPRLTRHRPPRDVDTPRARAPRRSRAELHVLRRPSLAGRAGHAAAGRRDRRPAEPDGL